MTLPASKQFKVWAFLKRNVALLSHDDYRAGHVGFHCSNTRRLKAIRGYTVNIHSDDSGLGRQLVASGTIVLKSEPDGFLDMWDGFPSVLFDDRQSWIAAVAPEPTRAAAEGLIVDPDWTLTDGPFLFDRIDDTRTQFRSYHTRMEEYVVKPVLRFEARPCKLVQFFRKTSNLSDAEFRQLFFNEYAALCRKLDGLNGLVANFRYKDIDAAARHYYPDDHWCFSPAGRAFRDQFYRLWTGALELYFDDIQSFLHGRQNHPLIVRLMELEQQMFESIWYVQVDENVIVMPNRNDAPSFYYR